MKKPLIKIRGIVLLVFFVSSSTTILLSHLAANEHTNCSSSGANPRKPIIINAAVFPGSFEQLTAFLSECEPATGVEGYPVVTGLIMRTKAAQLDEIARTPLVFVKARQQPFTMGLVKMMILRNTAERVIAGEKIKVANKEALARLFDETEALSFAIKEIECTSHHWKRGLQPNNVDEMLSATVQRANSAALMLRTPTS